MPCWSHRSDTGVCSRRWSRSMATFSGTLKRFRLFLDMGKPPLEIVAYSSALFFPFRLKQNNLEHNYGHGEQNLSVVLALLMMLAFLVDQVQQLCCPLFQAAWHKMKTKCHLWEELRNHFRTLLFDSMADLLTALIRG